MKMSLYKRKGSPYYWCDLTLRGKRVKVSTKQITKYLAGIVESEMRMKALREGIDSLTRKSPTLEAFSAEFLRWVEATNSIEPQTKRCYRNGWRLLSGTSLLLKPLDAIRNYDCQTILFPGSASNANQALRTLRRMFAMAVELGRLNQSPKIELRKEWRRSVAMSGEQAQAIAARMPEGDARDAFLILRGTGMRPKECFSMRWDLVDWEKGYYQTPSGKTRSAQRKVPLFGAAAILQRRRIEQGLPTSGWVFPSKTLVASRAASCGHLVTIHKTFTKARKAAGLPDSVVLYSARHGALTDFSSRMSLPELMSVGGHSDSKIAMVYQHPDLATIQEKMGRVQ